MTSEGQVLLLNQDALSEIVAFQTCQALIGDCQQRLLFPAPSQEWNSQFNHHQWPNAYTAPGAGVLGSKAKAES